MAYEAMDPYLSHHARLTSGHVVQSTRLNAGSWLGLAVAVIVILAGAVTVYLGPHMTTVQVDPPEVVTPSVTQITPPDVTDLPGERVPPRP